jgi:hypothetical protein
MPSESKVLTFKRNNLKANAIALEGVYGLHRERDVPVAKFLVAPPGGGEMVWVEEGKHKSAMLLLFLADFVGTDEFVMTQTLRGFVRDYYGDDLCMDAQRNAETTHTTIRDLLDKSGKVTVRIWRS